MQETDPRAPSVPDPVVRISHWYGVVIGLVSAAVAVSSAVFIASLANTSSPINTVGNSFIDRAPSWLKEFSTAAFETNSKTVLQSGIWIVLVVVAVVLGYRSTTSIAPLVGGIVFFAIIGYASAIDQPNNNLITALAPFIGATLGILSAIYLASLFRVRTRSINTPSESQVPLGWDRRRFVQSAALLGVAAAAVGVVGRRNEVARINSARAQIPKTLPPVVADETATFIETGFHPAEPFITPTASFYRIDTALSFPTVNIDNWKMQIHGLVNTPREFSYRDLQSLPQVERIITLACVSNPVGGRYIGNAVWQGVWLKDLLEQCGIQQGAQQVFSRSIDGWTCGFPIEAALDGRDAMIAIGMNGEPLSLKHGFPARLVVPGLYGYVSATKWLAEIELSSWDKKGYWIPRGWSREAPIKTQSRIDVPRQDATLRPGLTQIAGVAWAQFTGIERVEVRVDDGPWQIADLGSDTTNDAWRQWVLPWDATAGEHIIQVRATDKSGYTQTEVRQGVAPDGATGWHTRRIRIS